ncbi:winged helix-turn-helix domain-containing protein [Amycolatopsis taiwanensis]|uniref:winged helix-turn-helix domain-containing protein n=1 Tax=Amycolatopsis taiwanensis TaxID=342230 RepID=UPI0012EB2303|nr:winged helix-turn-helix domain-containing protein [Amycolatopsis taiwanensis]
MLYVVWVRYPDGGGLTAEGRARREAVRLQAAEMLAQKVPVPEIARRLRVSQNAVYVWRRRWLAEGEAGLASKGPSGTGCRLSDAQLDRLAVMMEEGPAAHGYAEDQRWTLARVADLIATHFRIRYTLRGVSLLLHRMGFSPQMPAHRPVERDEEAVANWRREAWQQAKS